MKLLALMFLVAVAAGFALAPAATVQTVAPPEQSAWRTFEGSWSASGHRQSLQTEGRAASTIYLSGAVVLTVSEGVSRGFRGEVIGFDDGATASIGRSVWTDERGDRIFATLRGETIGTGRRFAASITGGTGRYAGITGEYSLEWQYVVEADQGTIQGRTVGLKGRYRAREAGK